MADNIPAVSGFTDIGRVRQKLYQSGKEIQAPYGAGLQPLDATLTSLAAYNTNGLLTQTAANTFTGRTITGTASQVAVANGDGVSGNPTLSLSVGALIAGTWTPTLTAVANVAASGALASYYMRVGDQVFCWGLLTVDPTAAAGTQTDLGISLPIASNLGAAGDLAGSSAATINENGGGIFADTANDRANLRFFACQLANHTQCFTFAYRII